MKRARKRIAIFQAEFREDLRFWVKTEGSNAIRVLDLIEAVMREPFEGPGKPEPLRYLLAGCWSRRVTQEHRLVYRVAGKRGVDQRIIDEWMGHQTEAMRKRYRHLFPKDRRAAIACFSLAPPGG